MIAAAGAVLPPGVQISATSIVRIAGDRSGTAAVSGPNWDALAAVVVGAAVLIAAVRMARRWRP